MREYGNVSIPQEAFIAALRMGDELIAVRRKQNGAWSSVRGLSEADMGRRGCEYGSVSIPH